MMPKSLVRSPFNAALPFVLLILVPWVASASRSLHTAGSDAGGRSSAPLLPDKIGDAPVAIENMTARLKDNAFMASPSIVKLDDGRLLTMFEVQPGSRGRSRPSKQVKISGDGGLTWTKAGRMGPMQWPTLFTTRSGVYALGVERHFSANNNVVISKMLDDSGSEWSEPVRITEGLAVVTANGGIDVSQGIVTKAIEVVPALNAHLHQAKLSEAIEVDFSINMASFADWVAQHGGPRVTEVTARVGPGISKNLVPGQVLQILHKPTSTKGFFKLVAADLSEGTLCLRPEAYNLIFRSGPVTFPAGSVVQAANSSAHSDYGSTSWASMVLQAPEDADLLDPTVWRESNRVSNPANLMPEALAEIFGIDAPLHDMKELLSPRESKRLVSSVGRNRFRSVQGKLGFGSTFMMEGTPVRLQDTRGGDGSLQVLLRVNNDINCNFGALVTVKDSQTAPLHLGWRGRAPGAPGIKASAAAAGASRVGGAEGVDGPRELMEKPSAGGQPAPEAEFMRFASAPGISIAHSAILYDPVADIYWYVNNVPRDSLRNWYGGRVHVSKHSSCEADRTTLGLYYSGNAIDWVLAGLVDYGEEFHQHFTYPHMLIDGEDLLVVSRATLPGAPKPYNNHSSNAIVMHRVRDFRRHAYLDWVKRMDLNVVADKGPLRWKQGVVTEQA